jgi:thiamine biosynthesis lipoprotein
VTPWRTVTVAAASCLDANVASTAAVVLGEDACVWLETRRLPARAVRRDGSVVAIAGWPSIEDAA